MKIRIAIILVVVMLERGWKDVFMVLNGLYFDLSCSLCMDFLG